MVTLDTKLFITPRQSDTYFVINTFLQKKKKFRSASTSCQNEYLDFNFIYVENWDAGTDCNYFEEDPLHQKVKLVFLSRFGLYRSE